MASKPGPFCLKVTFGKHKERCWKIGDQPSTLGRGASCDILIDDPLVSRRHCLVWLEEDRVFVKDLGSSNALLVNGRPVQEAKLEIGDELAAGNTALVLFRQDDQNTPHIKRSKMTLTPITAHLSQTVYLNDALPSPSAAAPQTVLELHQLFTMSRRFSEETTLAGLIETLAVHLRDRFHPADLWVAAYINGEDQLVFHSFTGAAGTANAPRKALLRAIHGNTGILLLDRNREDRRLGVTMVAPMAYGEDRVGVVALWNPPRQGAYDETDLHYLLALSNTLAPFVRAVERLQQLQRDYEYGKDRLGPAQLIGDSPRIRQVREMVAKAAGSRLPLLLSGESGTGKDLAARLVHEQGLRAAQPYITINCATIPEPLFESEMFGHERGAFTGAEARKAGWFDEANGGTLLLDEIADLSPANQAKMLRVIETGAFCRVGATQEVKTDARIIAASNRPLPELVAAGSFRQDLYYRLQGLVIEMPPLRTMAEDIPLLARHFLDSIQGHLPHAVSGFSTEAMALLQSWKWPGNVRELRASIERAACMARTDTLQPEDLALEDPASSNHGEVQDTPCALAEIEKRHITRVLRKCQGKVRPAAELLGISHVTLYAKLRQYGLDV